jgi:hypothetical protein
VISNRGPWPHEDVSSFLDLSERIGTIQAPRVGQRLSSLMSLLPLPNTVLSDGDFASIEKAWEARRKHPVYKWLDENENFRAARSTFYKLKQKAQSEKLKAPTAEFAFMRLVVESADLFLRRKQNTSPPRKAHKRLRNSARNYAAKLLSSFQNGLGLPSYSQQRQLEGLLTELHVELRSDKRKPYGGVRVEGSHFLEFLAVQFFRCLDLCSPAIIQDIGNMVGVDRDSKACARYVKRAKEIWREALINAQVERRVEISIK